jgi:predicted N-acetyltransferase YhbS
LLKQIVDFMSVLTPEEIMKRAREGYVVYAADENGAVVGCAVMEKKKGWYFLKSLYVKKSHQGKGIGSRLCGLCEDRLRSLGYPSMHIDALNLPSTLGFYRSMGFHEMGREAPSSLFISMVKTLNRNV